MIIVQRFVVVAFALLLNLGIPPAHAVSFDCTAASAADETTICSDPKLSALDSEMSGLWYGYKAIPLLMGMSGNREDAARAFLSARAKCGTDAACLTNLYKQRISTLKSDIDWATKNYCRQ